IIRRRLKIESLMQFILELKITNPACPILAAVIEERRILLLLTD
ncbi:hypothetical protein CISIN_1g037218mg, partial [Citrus sinensis]